MLRIFRLNGISFSNLQYQILGDGTNTVATFDISKTPFNLDFKGGILPSISVDSVTDGFIATVTLIRISGVDTLVTTLDHAPPNDSTQPVLVNVGFHYPSIA